MTTTVRISDVDTVTSPQIFMNAALKTAAGQTDELVADLTKISTKDIFDAVLAAGCEKQAKDALIDVLIQKFGALNKSLSGVEKKTVSTTDVPTEKPAEKKPATKPFVWADAVDDVAVTEVKVVADGDPTYGDHEVDDDTAVTESTETDPTGDADVADDGSTGWTPARTRQLTKKLAKAAKAAQPTNDGKQTEQGIAQEPHDGLVADEYHSVPPALPAGHEEIHLNKFGRLREVTSAPWFFGGNDIPFEEDFFAWSWKLTENGYSKPWGWIIYKGNYNHFQVMRGSRYVHKRGGDNRWSHYRIGPDGTLQQVTVKEVIDYFTPEAFRKGRA